MKKKILSLALALLLCMPLLAACGGGADDTAETPQPTESTTLSQDELVLNLATGSTSGAYYPFGGALAQVVKNRVGYITLSVNASGASRENILQIASGDTHLAIVQNDILDYAFHGSRDWEYDAVTNLAALMTLYPEVVQLVVPAGSAIKSVGDLEGKRVATGDAGSGVEANARQILEVHELDFSEISSYSLGFAASAEALKAGEIDAFFMTAGTPNTALMNLQADLELRIIGLEEDKIAALIDKYPFYTEASLDQNDYSFLGEDPLATVAVRATLVCSRELDEQVIYDLVKGIVEGHGELESLNAKGAYLSADYAVQGISIEFHPGAQRYYEGVGAMVGGVPASSIVYDEADDEDAEENE